MRTLGPGLTALIAACLIASASRAQATPDAIEAVYHPDVMFWSIEDGGVGRFRLSAREDYTFPVSHDDYVAIRDLMEPLRDTGVPCATSKAPPTGYIVWRAEGAERRQGMQTACYSDPAHQNYIRHTNAAYYAMRDMAEARQVAPPGLPEPTQMTLVWRSWGNRLVEWTIPRGGEAAYVNRDAPPVTFSVSAAEFDRFRDLFRPWEGVRFECERVITDGAYGSVVWSQPGHEDQSLNFDAGCVTGDAADVFERLERAEKMLEALRDGS
ncbi:hypothetical protein [Brevundimonas lenta]|uniref:Secreted protein n=1 Tax=Brevundimonas lenta TaxID=424796 RepID=A0A7W6NRQ6_9CAUL|nr:hypothetical protein [Brevundimonas lenta]MBB4084425.1 hypothetical protein [Brevundimonas lenta]